MSLAVDHLILEQNDMILKEKNTFIFEAVFLQNSGNMIGHIGSSGPPQD